MSRKAGHEDQTRVRLARPHESRLSSCFHEFNSEMLAYPRGQWPEQDAARVPLVLPNRSEKLRRLLPPGTELLILQVRSVPASLAGYFPVFRRFSRSRFAMAGISEVGARRIERGRLRS